jgi:Tetracyclin repressor-like, C-terminal domain
LAELEFPDRQKPWQERMRELGWSYRKMALRHPGFYPYLAVYRMNSLDGLNVLDQILEVFEATGLELEMRARQFRIFGYFIVGSCLDETIGYAKGPSAAEPVPHEIAAQKFPAIMTVGRFFSPDHHARTFEIGLEAMISEIERLVALSGK